MRWVVVIGVALLVIAVIMSTRQQTDVYKTMAKCRAAKKKKAAERKTKVTYTPPAKLDGGIMKVA